MSRKIKMRCMLACVVFACVFLCAVRSGDAFAVDNSTILKKWVFTQYYSCIRNNIVSPLASKDRGGRY